MWREIEKERNGIERAGVRGEIIVADAKVGEMSDDALSDFRAKNIGFIFQNFNLLPVLSAYENIEYPLLLAGASAKKRGDRVPRLLKAVGLSDRAKNLPGQLSGGQRQRVAIARALVNQPAVLLADEPTGNLDQRTGAEIIALFERLHHEGVTVILVTHDHSLAERTDRQIVIVDGRIARDTRSAKTALATSATDSPSAASTP